MIFNMVGGGSSNPFAMVLVNYPQNSTLTATNVDGYKDIADSTSANPQRLYYVSQPSGETQTCVFTITDGTQTKTETVSGITVGTAQTITMAYAFVLFENGQFASGYNWERSFTNNTYISGNNIAMITSNTFNGFSISPQINLADYNSLKFTYSQSNSSGDAYRLRMGLTNSSVQPETSTAEAKRIFTNYYECGTNGAESGTCTIDIQSISTPEYVSVAADVNGTISRIWLE